MSCFSVFFSPVKKVRYNEIHWLNYTSKQMYISVTNLIFPLKISVVIYYTVTNISNKVSLHLIRKTPWKFTWYIPKPNKIFLYISLTYSFILFLPSFTFWFLQSGLYVLRYFIRNEGILRTFTLFWLPTKRTSSFCSFALNGKHQYLWRIPEYKRDKKAMYE